jgi:PAS domain S-box-containing protein
MGKQEKSKLDLFAEINTLKRANEFLKNQKELAFQNKEKEKRADELALANIELAFQNEEKEKRADELALANTELAFQNEEKEKRADELALANTELAFQNKEKEKRADELALANTELAFQNKEKGKRADELALANTELAFQNKEKEKRADELALANTELAFQNKEKEKRADELALANTELAFQNKEKEKRADELALANTELAFQNEEKEKRADELVLANTELAFQNREKEKRADELVLANKELAFQKKLEGYRSEMESVALELTLLIDTANAPIFGIDNKGLVNEWNQTSEKITGFTKDEVLGNDLVQTYITQDYRESVKKVLENALKGKETANYEFPLFAKDGERVMVLLNSSTRRNAAGEITGVLGVGQDITEIDKLRTVSESIAKELRQFIETANAPIFGIDADGKVNEWNQTSEKITGFKKDEVLGKDLVETYITEDYRKAVKQVLDNALKGTETANYEFPLFTKDGRRVMVLLNSSTRRNADGKIIGVLGVGQDISELDAYRTRTEAIAKELRQFIETANAPIFGIDADGKVNEWNQTSEKITGFKKEEVLGKDLVETYITEDYRKAVKQVLDNALKGTETANYEFPLFTKDGRRVMVLLNSSTRRDADGKIIGVLGVGQDISELDAYRTRTEAIAKELRQFIETANAPIFGIDADGKVNEWNQTSEKITGFKKDEVLGKDLVETYITEDYCKSVKQVLDNALKGKETANYEFPLFTKDGRRVMVLLNSSTRRDADGKIIGVLGVGQDISQMDNYKTNLEDTVRKRTFELENSLEREKELGKLKTSFVAMASHEFRTPLAAIQAATDVILRYKDKLSQEDIEKRLFKIKREVNDMKTMLEDILIIGKAESQKLQFNTNEQDLVDLVKNIVLDYQLTQEEEREVIYKISMDKIMLNVDPKWIKHIILNLLSNALKYSEAPASVIIEIRQEENEVILSVTDQGIGFSKKDQESLFEPFHRGQNVGNIQGTGLGLSVLQTAIELHKGKIKVESKLNNGSTFIVSLPYNRTI